MMLNRVICRQGGGGGQVRRLGAGERWQRACTLLGDKHGQSLGVFKVGVFHTHKPLKCLSIDAFKFTKFYCTSCFIIFVHTVLEDLKVPLNAGKKQTHF